MFEFLVFLVVLKFMFGCYKLFLFDFVLDFNENFVMKLLLGLIFILIYNVIFKVDYCFVFILLKFCLINSIGKEFLLVLIIINR